MIHRALFLIAVTASLVAQTGQNTSVAPYYPTPIPIVRQMLEAGDLKPGELHYDLGSGDGRIVMVAARDFGARSVGYEIDQKLVASSRKQIAELGLEKATIRQEDLYQADFTDVDLVTTYLLPRALEKLRPLLEQQLKKGAHVVSHDFYFEGWEADETISVDYEVEEDGLLHSIYVYRR